MAQCKLSLYFVLCIVRHALLVCGRRVLHAFLKHWFARDPVNYDAKAGWWDVATAVTVVDTLSQEHSPVAVSPVAV